MLGFGGTIWAVQYCCTTLLDYNVCVDVVRQQLSWLADDFDEQKTPLLINQC